MKSLLGLICLMLSMSAQSVDNVSLQLKWTHQFQFAGYYMAAEKGFYKEAGLNVAIIPADPNDPDTFPKVLNDKPTLPLLTQAYYKNASKAHRLLPLEPFCSFRLTAGW